MSTASAPERADIAATTTKIGLALTILRGRELPLALAAFSLGAGAIHFAVAPEHFAEYWVFGVFFVGLAWLQSMWAVLYPIRPLRMLGFGAALVNTVTVALWLWTRTVGLPIGPDAGQIEPIGAPDIAATAFEIAIVLGLAWHLAVRNSSLRVPAAPSPARLLLLAGSVVLVVGTTAVVLLLPPSS